MPGSRRFPALVAILAAVLLLAPMASYAANITAPGDHINWVKSGPVGNLYAGWPSDPARCDIIYHGEVTVGDAKRLRAAYNSIAPNPEALKHGFQFIQPMLCLRSPGGSVDEGIELVRVIRELGLVTVIEDGQMCASMCAVAFLAGTRRMSWLGSSEDRIEFPRRFLHPRGRLLFHSPFVNFRKVPEEKLIEAINDPAGGGIKAWLFNFYRDGLADAQRIIEAFKGYSQASYRVLQPWVRQSLLLEKMANDRREWVCVDTVDMVGRWEIDVFGYSPPKTPSNEQIFDMCRSNDQWRQDVSAAGPYSRPRPVNVAMPNAGTRLVSLRRVYYNSLDFRCVIEGWPKQPSDLDEIASFLLHYKTDKGERVSENLSVAPFALLPPETLLADLPGVKPRPNASPLAADRPTNAYVHTRMHGCSYRALAQSNAEQCRQACARDSWCEGYSFNKLSGRCELKHTLTALRDDTAWDSGVPSKLGEPEASIRKPELRELLHERRPGATANSVQLVVPEGQQLAPGPVADAAACRLSCELDEACIAATFEAKGPACRRFRSISGGRLVDVTGTGDGFGQSWAKTQ